MATPWTALVAGTRWTQRVLIVLLALLPLLIVTLAYVPALVLLPFFPGAANRTRDMVRQLITWTRTALIASRNR
ncbi:MULTISPECIES: hypothetical protein [unclassified Streptomyces]|uniref:hypothetical protein n=1 Tax=unclassified Streptomyces TaxID=2593676 RepID=UPI00278C19E2|nr:MULTISPECIES: hypothetical protein [unclassified Streptomyces]